MKPELFEILKKIGEYSIGIKNGRNQSSIAIATLSEMGELADEINIEYGNSDNKPSEDGVFGESVDVMICVVDMYVQAGYDLDLLKSINTNDEDIVSDVIADVTYNVGNLIRVCGHTTESKNRTAQILLNVITSLMSSITHQIKTTEMDEWEFYAAVHEKVILKCTKWRKLYS